jgi:hypothetical protein
MIRPQTLTTDIDSSDSVREGYYRVTPRRVSSRARSSSTSTRLIRKGPRNSRLSWRSSCLKWNILQTGDAEEVLRIREGRNIDGTLAHPSSTQRIRERSDEELPLSDPKSWVWQGKKDAKLAVAIDASNGIFSDVPRPRDPVSKRTDLDYGEAYLPDENLETKRWLDRIDSTYALCF